MTDISMTDDNKALVERLKRFSTRPIEHDAPAMNRIAMKEAADRIEAQAAEIERLREHLISALDTLKDAEVCNDECGPCNEALAALEQSK
jgi:HAMP domain-containing protein